MKQSWCWFQASYAFTTSRAGRCFEARHCRRPRSVAIARLSASLTVLIPRLNCGCKMQLRGWLHMSWTTKYMSFVSPTVMTPSRHSAPRLASQTMAWRSPTVPASGSLPMSRFDDRAAARLERVDPHFPQRAVQARGPDDRVAAGELL